MVDTNDALLVIALRLVTVGHFPYTAAENRKKSGEQQAAG